jgi:hypothetical protein
MIGIAVENNEYEQLENINRPGNKNIIGDGHGTSSFKPGENKEYNTGYCKEQVRDIRRDKINS